MSSEKYINTAHEGMTEARKAISKAFATSRKIKNKTSTHPEKHISEALRAIKVARMTIKKVHITMKKAVKKITKP